MFLFPIEFGLFLKKEKIKPQTTTRKKPTVPYKSQIKAGQSSNTKQKKNILHLEGPFFQTSKLKDFSITVGTGKEAITYLFSFSSPFAPSARF